MFSETFSGTTSLNPPGPLFSFVFTPVKTHLNSDADIKADGNDVLHSLGDALEHCLSMEITNIASFQTLLDRKEECERILHKILPQTNSEETKDETELQEQYSLLENQFRSVEVKVAHLAQQFPVNEILDFSDHKCDFLTMIVNVEALLSHSVFDVKCTDSKMAMRLLETKSERQVKVDALKKILPLLKEFEEFQMHLKEFAGLVDDFAGGTAELSKVTELKNLGICEYDLVRCSKIVAELCSTPHAEHLNTSALEAELASSVKCFERISELLRNNLEPDVCSDCQTNDSKCKETVPLSKLCAFYYLPCFDAVHNVLCCSKPESLDDSQDTLIANFDDDEQSFLDEKAQTSRRGLLLTLCFGFGLFAMFALALHLSPVCERHSCSGNNYKNSFDFVLFSLKPPPV